jgi:hypothetical protein
MATSSAKPAKLLAYRDAGLAQVEAWEPEVGNLATALSELRSALSGRDLPDGCDVTVLFHETWFDTLARNQRHLDEWVGDVADGFVRAGGGDPAHLGADQSFTVDDSAISVGFASRAESEAQAREDAQALDEILGEYGLLHPYDISNNPELLQDLADTYPELRDILARAQRFAHDENYAVALVNELGPRDVRTMADLANTFGIAHDQGHIDIDADAYDGYVVPLAVILGNADRSGRMDDDVREALFDMDATDEPPVAGTDGDLVSGELADMRYRSMALLLYAGDFSPATTAEMAHAIMHDSPIHPSFYDRSGFTDPVFLQDHRELASNEWGALAALERDDHAANLFYRMDRDGFPGELENLFIMGGDPGLRVAAERLGVSPDDLRGEIQQTLANTMTGGILEYPLATGTTYAPETAELVSAMVQAAGSEHVDAHDVVRTAMAQISTPYTLDLASAAAGPHDILPPVRLPGLSDDDIDAFLQEVSGSEAARVVLGQNAAALVVDQLGLDADAIAAGDGNAFGVGGTLATAYYRELGEAWHAVQVDELAQREALVAGWRSFTDPVVDLVSGKIVEKIPVVNVAADLPLASNVVDGVTSAIRDGINSAVYDNLIPRPELEAMTTWRDAIQNDLRSVVPTALYDNEAARQTLLDRARAGEPALYAQITADGEVTLDEFMDLRATANAAETQVEKIVTGFEADMAFNEVFGKVDG